MEGKTPDRAKRLLLAVLFCCASPALADSWTPSSYKAEVFRVSYNVKKAAEDAEIYKGRYLSELAGFYLPSVLISASGKTYSAYHAPPSLRFRQDETSAGVAASLNLFNGFKDKLSLDSSRLLSRIYQLRLWQERQSVTLAALDNYYSVLRKKRLLEIVRDSLTSYQRQYEKVKRYYNKGIKSYSDVLKSELNVRSGQLSEAASIEDYKNAVMDFNSSLYRKAETEVELEDFASYSPPPVSREEKDIDYALSHRPELEILGFERKIAGYSSKKAGIERFPDFSVDAYYDRQGIGKWGRLAADAVNPDYYLKLSLSFPFGRDTFFEKQASLEASTALERAHRAVRDMELLVRREVLTARLALSTAVTRYEVAGLKAGISKRNLGIVNNSYNSGRSGIIELAEAQRDDLGAQSELANALYDLLQALARYDSALGRQLW